MMSSFSSNLEPSSLMKIAHTGAVMMINIAAMIGMVLACALYSRMCRFLTSSKATGPRAVWKRKARMLYFVTLDIHVHVSTYSCFVIMHEWYVWTDSCSGMNKRIQELCK